MRNPTNADKVREFMLAMGQDVDKRWARNSNLDVLRWDLLLEEVKEVAHPENKENLLKELCDLLYVTYGYAITFGLDIDTAFNRVHQSNMSKLVNGKPLLREDGKVLKGPNYKPADLSDLV